MSFPPLPWGLQALVQQHHLGKEKVPSGPMPAAEHVGRTNAAANQALTQVWSGRVTGVRTTSLAPLFVVIKASTSCSGPCFLSLAPFLDD